MKQADVASMASETKKKQESSVSEVSDETMYKFLIFSQTLYWADFNLISWHYKNIIVEHTEIRNKRLTLNPTSTRQPQSKSKKVTLF